MRTSLPLALPLLTLLACDTQAEKPEAAQPAVEPQVPAEVEAPVAVEPPAEPGPTGQAAPQAAGDYLEIIANHEPKKPSDPAVMRLTGIKVVEAQFDPEKLEGATATFEIDMRSLASKVPDRDDHLKSDDFLDVEQFPVATVAVSEVEAVDDGYTAKATVTAKGVAATWQLSFEAVDVTDTSVRIRGTHVFDRSRFGIGKPGNQAEQLTANWDISLKKD